MPLSLITDRVQADVDQLKTIRAKLNNPSIGWSGLTGAEQAAWTAGKGANNTADLNRVGTAVQTLADLLVGYGYSITVNPRADWSEAEEPEQAAELAAYLADVQALKDRFYGAGVLPVDLELVTVEGLNNIEKLLLEVETNINNMIAAFWRCGELRCGEQ